MKEGWFLPRNARKNHFFEQWSGNRDNFLQKTLLAETTYSLCYYYIAMETSMIDNPNPEDKSKGYCKKCLQEKEKIDA